MYNYKIGLDYEDTEGFMQYEYIVLTHEKKMSKEEFNNYCNMAIANADSKFVEKQYSNIETYLKENFGFKNLKIENCFDMEYRWSR